MEATDMILLNEAAEAVGGNLSRPANAAGFLIHAAIHAARPDVNAACHTHSKYGKAFSSFAIPLAMINQDVTIFYGDAQAVYDDFGGVVLEKDESLRLAAALGPRGKGLILRNHGLLTVGGTVDEAGYLFTLLERSCEVQLLAMAAERETVDGRPGVQIKEIGEEAARYTFEMTSDPETLFCEFQGELEMEEKLCGGEFSLRREGELKAEKWL
jgi:ribulose-5-phosphate 4-epimerase/fuculose-1-phosphate aldolase